MEKIEPFLIYAGQAAIIASAVWTIISGQTRAGLLLLIGFLLIFQYGIVAPNLPVDTGSCWATGKTFYQCLPGWYRLSAHFSQLGLFVTALGVFLVGRPGAQKELKPPSDIPE